VSRLAVVSGASGEVGRVLTARLAGSGTAVVMLGRSRHRLDETVEDLLAIGIEASLLHPVTVDINDWSDVQRTAEKILDGIGTPLTLVHAAGDHPVGPVLATTAHAWQAAIDSKFLSAVRLIHAFGGAMRAQHSGAIVLIGGVTGHEPSPLLPIESSLNAALGALAKAVSRDFAADNVRVNVVDPGPLDTQRWMATCEELAAYSDASAQEIDAASRRGTLLGRLASPDDVSAAVEFLASGHARFLTGSSVVVDGGMSVGRS
jgi:3-oxoacyl-[acyl-carrier protein] reductase